MTTLGFVSMTPIEKGWSGDRKYKAVTENGAVVLLRVSPPERKESRCRLFELLSRLPEEIPMSRPFAQGICREGLYTVYRWIDGEDAEAVIPALSAKEQYRMGREAGCILQKLHAVPAPDMPETWPLRFGRKIDRKLAQYADCGLSYPDGEQIVRFIEENRHLIEGRPQCFQHGDFHIGNLMVENGHLVVIDFDRYDFGDPWEEFAKIVWCAQTSPAFAAGQIDGYFDGNPPDAFFRLLALYIAVNTLSSLPWAIPFGQAQIDVFMAQEQTVMEWYDSFSRVVPKWYTEVKKRMKNADEI